MPIYAFACQACGHAFDSLQRMSDPDPAECPECGAAEIKRQLTAPSFRLSGSGWYETDFKKDGDRKRNIAGDAGEAKSATGDGAASKDASAKSDGGASPASAAGSSDSKAPAKTEAKPAPKPDPAPAAKPASAG